MSTKKRVQPEKIYDIISAIYDFDGNYSMNFARKIECILSKIDEKYPLAYGNSLDNIIIYIDKYLEPDRIGIDPVK